MQQLMRYMRSFWIDGAVFGPEDWVVYRQDIRTNNDLEGWHHRLNRKGKRASIPFYMLAELLYNEAVTVSINVEMIYREDELRRTRTGSKVANERLTTLWNEYREGQRSVRSLMLAASKLITRNARVE
ncbi:uncharacterized protein [Antedon mediterranea]|uniref:uncharacterized protein n=1 Tax=Antedon mediterranea TaxID=105859 RepID=UPI003AF915CC